VGDILKIKSSSSSEYIMGTVTSVDGNNLSVLISLRNPNGELVDINVILPIPRNDLQIRIP
jgi:hypothetical protein